MQLGSYLESKKTQQLGADQGPSCPIGALHGCHCSSRDFVGSAKYPSEK